jgi:predicted nucleic acid-binding protein
VRWEVLDYVHGKSGRKTKTQESSRQSARGLDSLRGRAASSARRGEARRGESRARRVSNAVKFVVDANVIAFALLPKKAIPANVAADVESSRRFLNRALSEGGTLIVPPDFSMEVLNAFTAAMYKRLMALSTAKRVTTVLKKLELKVLAPSQNNVLELTHRMNRASAADQTYLSLAVRLKCDFVTADRGVVISAANARIPRAVHVSTHPWGK